MQTKSSAVIVLAAAIVLAALIVVLSPMLWSDHFVSATPNAQVPNGCLIQSTPTTMGGMLIVEHCPFWVKVPN